jgi:hypothetical protein
VLRRAPAGNRILAVAALVAAVSLVGVGQAGATGNDKKGDEKKNDNSQSDNHGNSGKGVQKSDTSKPTAADHMGGDAPRGNNGHIQIDTFVMAGGNRNRPKAVCGFSVSFFGYDAGTQHATITMTPKSPTSGGTPLTVSTEWTVAHRTSGNQFNKNVPISPEQVAVAFNGVAPAKQGFHAKIDVHVTGSQGSDAKHKVLWIKPCATAASTTSSTTIAPTTTTTTAAAESAVHAQPATVTGGQQSSGLAATGTPGGSAGSASSASATATPGSSSVAGQGASASGTQIAPAGPAVAINAAATTTG